MSPRARAASSNFRLSATAEAERVLDGHDSGDDDEDGMEDASHRASAPPRPHARTHTPPNASLVLVQCSACAPL